MEDDGDVIKILDLGEYGHVWKIEPDHHWLVGRVLTQGLVNAKDFKRQQWHKLRR